MESSKEGLLRVIGVSGLALSIVNGVIGSGIFVLPAAVSLALGAHGVLAYVVCSIMLASILLCYAEIGSKITSSGGSYTYVEAAFGHFPGFVVNWLYFFGWSTLGSAAVMNVIADSLSVLWPVFQENMARGILFFILLSFMVGLNISGARQGIRFIKSISIIKLLPLLIIIFTGIFMIQTKNLQWGEMPELHTFADTSLILFFAFAGFETSLGLSGEFINPKRTVPLGIFAGGLTVLFVYMMLQMVTQGVIGHEIALHKEAPLAAIAEKMIGKTGLTLMLLAAAVSCFGSVTADVMATPRSLFAGAKNGLFPAFLAKVHSKYFTPYIAISVYGLLIFIFSVSGGFKQLAVLASAAILLIYLAVILAMLKLRNTSGESTEKTFRVPGGWMIPGVAIVAILWLLSSLHTGDIVATALFISIICLLYLGLLWFRKIKP